jgi:hypothetical protein
MRISYEVCEDKDVNVVFNILHVYIMYFLLGGKKNTNLLLLSGLLKLNNVVCG